MGSIFIVTPRLINDCNNIKLIKPINEVFLKLSVIFWELEKTLIAINNKAKIIKKIAIIPNSSAIIANT